MYSAKVLGKVEPRPGLVTGLKVGVFRTEGGGEEQIGEYERNYPAFYRTFYAFQKDGKDLALYSPLYAVTRVMELPSCKDLGGEEPEPGCFCPVDFYVPSYVVKEHLWPGGRVSRWVYNEPKEDDLEDTDTSKTVIPFSYYPFGFVAGCLWGDDSSWKIQYLDLSEAERGVIKRDERFGYIEMPYGMTLKQSIDMDGYGHDSDEEDARSVTIAIRRHFHLPTGKVLEW